MGTRKIKTWRDPYDMGYNICRFKEIEIQSGLTVLVGCNGYGKSTMLHNIQETVKKEHIPYLDFDTTKESVNPNNINMIALSFCSSEGENITLKLGTLMSQLKNFIATGETNLSKKLDIWSSLSNDKREQVNIPNERWILIDSVDSGYSIDNILDLKYIFSAIQDHAKKKNIELYIVVSANAYELANNEQCLDIYNGKYMQFNNYDEYKNFILKTRQIKEKREKKSNNVNK